MLENSNLSVTSIVLIFCVLCYTLKMFFHLSEYLFR